MKLLNTKCLMALLSALFSWAAAQAQIDTLYLDPSGLGTQGDSVFIDSSQFDIDLAGTLSYTFIGEEDWENFSGTTDESPFFGNSFGIYWGGISQADTSTGAIIQPGGIHRPGPGNLGVPNGTSAGVEPGEGLFFGLDLSGLPSNASVKIIGITTGFLSTSTEPARIIDLSDSTNFIRVTSQDPDEVDISSMNIELSGGQSVNQLISIVHVGTAGAWRINGLTVALSSVAGVNTPPAIANPLNDLTIDIDTMLTLDVSNVFTDVDGDSLTLSAVSGDPAIFPAALNGDSLTISPVALGASTLTLTADDGMDSTDHVITITVAQDPNQSPTVVNPPGDIITRVDSSIRLDISNVFDDPDGDALTLNVLSNDPAIATATISNDSLIVEGVSVGMTTVVLSANDGLDTVEVSFSVMVDPPTSISAFPFAFSVYPNPVKDQLQISLESPANFPLSFSIIDLTGRILLSTPSIQRSLNQPVLIDLGSLPSGNYFLKIESKGVQAVRQIVKE